MLVHVLVSVVLWVFCDARKFSMSMAGSQFVPNQLNPIFPLFHQFSVADLAADSEVINFHPETYGVPWDVLINETQPPASWQWTLIMKDFANQGTQTQKDVFLALLLGRSTLSDRANLVANDGVTYTANFVPNCFDFNTTLGAQYKQSYLRYVDFMVKTFKPKYVNVGVEANFFLFNCPNQWGAFADVLNAAYDTAKAAISPAPIVFSSFTTSLLYNNTATQFDQAHYNALKVIKRDRFAISTYPDPKLIPTLPADYFTRGAEIGNEIPLVAETGTNSVTIFAGNGTICFKIVDYSPELENQYLKFLLESAETRGIDLINWWSYRDLLPANVPLTCPPVLAQCGTDNICQVINIFRASFGDPVNGEFFFKTFGTMGIRDWEGNPKSPIFETWTKKLAEKVVNSSGNFKASFFVVGFLLAMFFI